MNQCFPGEEDESFSMLFWLPVFTGVPVTCDAYQDSSLALRMTAAEGGERIIRHAFLAAGIYWRLCHFQLLPKFFAGAQNDLSGVYVTQSPSRERNFNRGGTPELY